MALATLPLVIAPSPQTDPLPASCFRNDIPFSPPVISAPLLTCGATESFSLES